MKMCQPHWDMLRAEIASQGLSDWVVRDGETAAMQLVDQFEREEATPVNYDPLMACHNMVMGRALDIAGIMVLHAEFGCPICFFNEHRTADGRCGCEDPECDLREPGSVPDFETWLVGPDSCVTAAKGFMVSEGWIATDKILKEPS